MVFQILSAAVLCGGVVALFWWGLRSAASRIEGQYSTLSRELGLELTVPEAKLYGFVRPEPSLYGTFKGHEVSVSAPGVGLQKTRQSETVLKIGINKQPLVAQIVSAGMFARLQQRGSSGLRRISREGDTVDIRASEARNRDLLIAAPFHAWLSEDLPASKASVYIGEISLAYVHPGLLSNVQIRTQIATAAEQLTNLAIQLDE